MTFEKPTAGQLKEIGKEFGFEMDDQYVSEVLDYMTPFADAYNAIEDLPDALPAVKYARGEWHRPEGDENRHGGWYVRAEIKGADGGILAGKTVAIKDSACVAGIPMMNGGSVLDGYVPDMDATVVTRVLDAGATITGKSVCEYFCLSGGSLTSASGIVDSPRNPGFTPGGSSTGSAALVAAGDVDMALGGDQAGSVRIPASFSGIVGLKPTFGLVPYTGIMGIEATIDHAGPMTVDVADNALFLEAIAGEDGLDSRQRVPHVDRYTDALDKGVDGLRIAIVTEGFGRHDSHPDVDSTVRAAAAHLASIGATVDEVSIPMHDTGLAIWGAICLDAMYTVMYRGYGFGQNLAGVYPTSLVDAMAAAGGRENEFPDTFKFALMLGQYANKTYGSHHYAKAQNQRRVLTAAMDAVLAQYDLLLMPATAMMTSRIPHPGAGFLDTMQHCWEAIGNTAPTNVSGHPAISVPCGFTKSGLPVGLQLVGRPRGEAELLRFAARLEEIVALSPLAPIDPRPGA